VAIRGTQIRVAGSVARGFLIASGALVSVLVDPTIELEDAEIELDGVVVGYARSLALGTKSAKVDAALARMCLSGSAVFRNQPVTRDICEIIRRLSASGAR
jgi:hypothetical protein